MNKKILYTITLLLSLLTSQIIYSYELRVKNFNYVSPNILEFEIFVKGPAPQYYVMGQYAFNINPGFANGGILTFTMGSTFSDLPVQLRPSCAGVYTNQLRLSPNLPVFEPIYFPISNTGIGTKVIRVRLQTSACTFAGNLNLAWRNAADGGFYTKYYDDTFALNDPDDPESGYYLTSMTNIANASLHFVDPIPPASAANVLVNPGCGGFSSLGEAFSAINTNSGGIYTNQNVTVSILNNTIENSSAVLNGDIFNTCIIRPVSNSISVTAGSGVQDLIVFDGADNVTIDGRVGGTGNVQLSAINPNTGNPNTCIKMINGSSNNIVQNLISVCSGAGTDANNIYVAETGSSLSATGNNDNTIQNCFIEGGYCGIYVTANPLLNQGSKINSGTIVLNNEVKNFNCFGINTSCNTKNNRIENNRVIFGTAPFHSGEIYLYGIGCAGIGTNYVTGNRISSTTNSTIHTYYLAMTINPIHTQQIDNTASIFVINNFISVIDDEAGYIYGIYCASSPNYGEVVQTTKVEHNTVYIGKSGPTTSNFSVGIGLYNLTVTGSVYDIYNNVSINERGNSSNPQSQYAVEVQPGPAVTLNVDFNCYWSSGNFALWNLTSYNNLSAYQSAAFPNEQNTILKNVNFAGSSAGDLHLSGASISDFDLIGKTGTGVTTDIDMDLRSTIFPYKGADESITIGGATSLNLKFYAEGFYNASTNQMRKSIPVSIYLKRAVFPFTTVSVNNSTLDANGNLPSLNFNIPYAGAYYIEVKNWNMIGTWNSIPQSFTVGGTTNYDFSTAVDQAFGNNMNQVDLSPSRWGVFVGDVNQDDIVNNTDVSIVHDASLLYTTGNVVTDLNGDEIIDVDDLIIARNNEAMIVSVNKP